MSWNQKKPQKSIPLSSLVTYLLFKYIPAIIRFFLNFYPHTMLYARRPPLALRYFVGPLATTTPPVALRAVIIL